MCYSFAMFKGLKHRHPIVYISLAGYIALSGVIIAESCMNGSTSSARSHILTDISAAIVNFFAGPQIPRLVAPTELSKVLDSSYLGSNEAGKSQIALGTTTLLTLETKFPEKDAKDVYDQSFEVVKVSGEANDYNTIVSSRSTNGHYYIDVRVVANAMNSADYRLDIKAPGDLVYHYDFNIVDLPAPTSYTMKVDGLTEGNVSLKQGQTKQIDVQLTGENRDDAYLRRYFDQTKLARSSNNEAIAYVDQYGVIHGLTKGETNVTYGKETFHVVVNDEIAAKPASNHLEITHVNLENLPSVLDYDYVFAKEENPNHYSSLLYASFENKELEDQSVTWVSSNPLAVKLAPHHYDENGYPVYQDEEGKPCVRACGYRKKEDTVITCISNADPSLKQTFSLSVIEAKAIDMKVNVEADFSFDLGKTKVLNALMTPKNTFVTAIHVESSDPKIVSVRNNDSNSVTLAASNQGTAHIIVTSVSNPSLKKEFDVTVTLKQAINEDNYDSFHGGVRKFFGHFSLFLITAVVGFVFFFTFFEDKQRYQLGLPITAGWGFLLAAISELIQHYVPNRFGDWGDIGIDFFGYFVGTVLSLAVFLLIMFIRKKHKERKQKKIDEKTS